MFTKETTTKDLIASIYSGDNGFVKMAAFNALEVREGREFATRCWLDAGYSMESLSPEQPKSEIYKALEALVEWGRTHTSPNDPNSPHELLIAGVEALKNCGS